MGSRIDEDLVNFCRSTVEKVDAFLALPCEDIEVKRSRLTVVTSMLNGLCEELAYTNTPFDYDACYGIIDKAHVKYKEELDAIDNHND